MKSHREYNGPFEGLDCNTETALVADPGTISKTSVREQVWDTYQDMIQMAEDVVAIRITVQTWTRPEEEKDFVEVLNANGDVVVQL